MMEMDKLMDEVEECEECSEDEKCRDHKLKIREARKIQEMRSDPQRNRIGVRGDPTPDSEYGR